MDIKKQETLEGLVSDLAHEVRSFISDGKALQIIKDIDDIAGLFSGKARDYENRLSLQALSLYAEYQDSIGNPENGRRVLRPIYSTLMDDLRSASSLGPEGDEAVRNLLRQKIWCCLAYSLCLYRANELSEMEKCLERLRIVIEKVLVAPGFPSWGTKSRHAYHKALLLRDQGHLEESSKCFELAIQYSVRRRDLKLPKYRLIDGNRARREELFTKGSIARSIAFGHGAIAFSKARYIEANGWFVAAREILDGAGQEMWQKSMDVYYEASTLLGTEIVPASQKRITEIKGSLRDLSLWFKERNPRYSHFAQAFVYVAELRESQIVNTIAGRDILDCSVRTYSEIESCFEANFTTVGTLSVVAVLQLIAYLLRGADFQQARKSLDDFQAHYGSHTYALPALHLLQAELAFREGNTAVSELTLTNLLENRSLGRAHKAIAWTLLSIIERARGANIWANQAMAAAEELLPDIQDGFTAALVQQTQRRYEREIWRSMPYQLKAEHAQSYSIDVNVQAAEIHTIEAAHRQWPSMSVNELSVQIDRARSWTYRVLKSNRHMPWVQKLLHQRAPSMTQSSRGKAGELAKRSKHRRK
jgi:hypothetical protein